MMQLRSETVCVLLLLGSQKKEIAEFFFFLTKVISPSHSFPPFPPRPLPTCKFMYVKA